MTPAVFECEECAADPRMHQYLCAECDGFMHLHASRREHNRGLVREKREEMVIDVKEGTARLKCAVAVLAVDLASGKAVLELKSNASTADAGGGAACRFCAAALLGDRIVPGHDACCSDLDCLLLDARACTEKLGCGHLCGGVVGEAPEARRLVSLEAFEPWLTHPRRMSLEVFFALPCALALRPGRLTQLPCDRSASRVCAAPRTSTPTRTTTARSASPTTSDRRRPSRSATLHGSLQLLPHRRL